MVQCFYFVFGGEFVNLSWIEFCDIDQIYIVGIFFDYVSVFFVWKVEVQCIVDSVYICYFIVYLYCLWDEEMVVGLIEELGV